MQRKRIFKGMNVNKALNMTYGNTLFMNKKYTILGYLRPKGILIQNLTNPMLTIGSKNNEEN